MHRNYCTAWERMPRQTGSKCIANCDAIPDILVPVYIYIIYQRVPETQSQISWPGVLLLWLTVHCCEWTIGSIQFQCLNAAYFAWYKLLLEVTQGAVKPPANNAWLEIFKLMQPLVRLHINCHSKVLTLICLQSSLRNLLLKFSRMLVQAEEDGTVFWERLQCLT